MKYYSDDGEIFRYETLDEAVESVFSNQLEELPIEPLVVYEGESNKKRFSDYISENFTESLLEQIGEFAYDQVGDLAEQWPDYTQEEFKQLHNALCLLLDGWANKSGNQPHFFGLKNVKEIKVKILNEDGDYEIVSPQSLATKGGL